MKELREMLAALAHAQWSGWMEHLFRLSATDAMCQVTIPRDAVTRWRRQMRTAYPDLPEHEKESDRKEADRVLDILRVQNAIRASGVSPSPPSPVWLDIETAPKQGQFLVYGHKGWFMVADGGVLAASRKPGTPAHLGGMHWTHWMPLPDPPAVLPPGSRGPKE